MEGEGIGKWLKMEKASVLSEGNLGCDEEDLLRYS